MQEQVILAAAGAVIKWLRGFPWFNDWATVAVAVGAAVILTIANGHAADVGSFFTAFSADIQTVLATLGAGHLLAKMSGGKVFPRNDQFSAKEVAK